MNRLYCYHYKNFQGKFFRLHQLSKTTFAKLRRLKTVTAWLRESSTASVSSDSDTRVSGDGGDGYRGSSTWTRSPPLPQQLRVEVRMALGVFTARKIILVLCSTLKDDNFPSWMTLTVKIFHEKYFCCVEKRVQQSVRLNMTLILQRTNVIQTLFWLVD